MSDQILSFARNLMSVKQNTVRDNTPTAIMGTIGSLSQSIAARPPYRVGLWPCVSNEHPEIAMGLWVLLAHLLERWRDVEVYRLFLQMEDGLEEFEWDIQQSQFNVDDWPVDPLDENIAIWGSLTKTDGVWHLKILIENDLLTGEDNETQTVESSAKTIGELINALPELSESIVNDIGASRIDHSNPAYRTDAELINDDAFLVIGEKLLQWEVHLLSMLWGLDWDDDDALELFSEVLESGKQVAGYDFASWAVAKTIGQSMLPGYSIIGDLLVDSRHDLVMAFPDNYYPAPMLATRVYQLGYVQEAYEMLENEAKIHPDNVLAWLSLAELYAAGGRLPESAEQFQLAIENGSVDNNLYRSYGNVLLAADQYGEYIETVILVDVETIPDQDDLLIWEAIEAYEQAIQLAPNDHNALYSQALQLAQVDETLERFWSAFVKLVSVDQTGDLIRDVIDGLYDVEDAEGGITALEEIAKGSGRVDAYINIAALHIALGDGSAAQDALAKAQEMADQVHILADIEWLLLIAEDPEFEHRFGELAAIVGAGNSLSAEDAEYLESAAAKAPHIVTLHVTLAQTYHTWGDGDAALEVLLDFQEILPDNPEVLSLLAKFLWKSDEKDLAFQYLNRGIQRYPFHVPLLVQTGHYLFDNGQLAEARTFLGRAEEIEPRSPALSATRAYIAKRIAERPDLYGGKS